MLKTRQLFFSVKTSLSFEAYAFAQADLNKPYHEKRKNKIDLSRFRSSTTQKRQLAINYRQLKAYNKLYEMTTFSYYYLRLPMTLFDHQRPQ